MLVVFDSHPVQYRVPIWRAIEAQFPGNLHVVYATDCSLRDHIDTGFDRAITWDDPMLKGYNSTILNCEHGKPLTGWNSLTGEGIVDCIHELKPSAILLTGINYRYDLIALLQAKFRGIPVWLRCENQDKALIRSTTKSILRSALYRAVYKNINKFFFIGNLNKQHYLKHGVTIDKLVRAPYGTIDRFTNFSNSEKTKIRITARNKYNIKPSAFVVGFSGKFIEKKNPEILFSMLNFLPKNLRSNLCLYFLGSGPLETLLQKQADIVYKEFGTTCVFPGFANQSELVPHYLAMDTLVLPSRRMGETWGLVANEAMQAGCSVIVSDAVGCGDDFNVLSRFKVFKEGDASQLAKAVEKVSQYSRDYNWASVELTDYSIEATANALIKELIALKALSTLSENSSV